MSILNNLRQARMMLKANNSSILDKQDAINAVFREAQEIIEQMNKEKLAAICEVEEKYRERLEEIDRELAVFTSLLG